MSEEVDFSSEGIKRKRRTRDESAWKRNKIKTQKARGQPHTSWKGVEVPKKVVGPDCKCKKGCFRKVSEDQRQRLLESFNNIGNKTEQDIYLQGGIKPYTPKKSKKRTAMYYYFVRVGLEEVNVCRTAFCSIFGEKNPNRVKRLCTLKSKNIIAYEGRGKHHNRPNRYDEELLKKIDDHIRSFPVYQTHYASKVNYFLQSELSVAKMHRMFLERESKTCCLQFIKQGGDQDKICCAPNLHVYRNYFINNFNLPFGRPKTDVCGTCAELKATIANAEKAKNEKLINDTKISLKVHLARANAFKVNFNKAKTLAKEKKNVQCIVFDFMQHVPLPHLPVSEIFYLRQMWMYTFGIHRYSYEDDKAYFYCWNECDAKHGVNEVLSCLNHFILNRVGPECDRLYIFSDACTGQNRNHAMVHFMTTLVNQTKIKTVHQHFPIRGHSFLQCDIDFACLGRIKKNIERAAVPSDWLTHFKEQQDFVLFPDIKFFCFNSYFMQFFKKNVISKKEKFTITKYTRITYVENAACIQVSESGNSNVWTKFNLLKPKVTPKNLRMPTDKDRLYVRPFSVPIKDEKLKDIKKLYKYLQEEEIKFYENVKGVSEPTLPSDGDE